MQTLAWGHMLNMKSGEQTLISKCAVGGQGETGTVDDGEGKNDERRGRAVVYDSDDRRFVRPRGIIGHLLFDVSLRREIEVGVADEQTHTHTHMSFAIN